TAASLPPSRHRRHGGIATVPGDAPTGMSVGSLVRVFTSIVDTVPLWTLATKTVLPSCVTTIPFGYTPTGMSVGFLVRVFTSIIDTVSLTRLGTKAVLPAGVVAIAIGDGPADG